MSPNARVKKSLKLGEKQLTDGEYKVQLSHFVATKSESATHLFLFFFFQVSLEMNKHARGCLCAMTITGRRLSDKEVRRSDTTRTLCFLSRFFSVLFFSPGVRPRFIFFPWRFALSPLCLQLFFYFIFSRPSVAARRYLLHFIRPPSLFFFFLQLACAEWSNCANRNATKSFALAAQAVPQVNPENTVIHCVRTGNLFPIYHHIFFFKFDSVTKISVLQMFFFLGSSTLNLNLSWDFKDFTNFHGELQTDDSKKKV